MRHTLLALVVVALVAMGSANATVVRRLSIDEVEGYATTVFTGTVRMRNAVDGGRDGTGIATEVTFENLAVVKGEIAAATVAYRFAGGTIGNRTVRYVGMPEFGVGERWVVFANAEIDPLCPAVGWWQGCYRVVGAEERIADARGRPVAGFVAGMPRLAGEGEDAMGLDAFLEMLRGIERDGKPPTTLEGESGGAKRLNLGVTTPAIGPTWPTAQSTYYSDPATISGTYLSEFQAAMSVWSSISGSKFRYSYGGTTSGNLSETNGITEVMQQNLGMFGYGVTKLQFNGSVMTEADIALNSSVTWNTGSTGNGNPHLRTVCTHELGHGLGLDDWANAPTDTIMDTSKDPAVVRSIYQPDRDAVAALYPDGTGPGPDPGEDKPDVLVDSVTFTPPDAGPGDSVRITYMLRNVGEADSGDFGVSAYLTGSLRPSAGDPYLGAESKVSVDADGSYTGHIDAVLDTDLLPGTWKIGVIADPAGTIGDPNQANNGGASVQTVVLERPPLALAPGQSVDAELGPLGRDAFTLDLFAGTKLKVKSTIERGGHELVLEPEAGGEAIAFSKLGRKAKVAAVIPRDGTYRLRLTSNYAGVARYQLATSAKKTRFVGSVVVDNPASVPIEAYRGARVKVVLKLEDGLKADIAVDGVPAEVKTNKSGKTVKITYVAPETGAVVIRVDPILGTYGTLVWKATGKLPKRGAVVSR